MDAVEILRGLTRFRNTRLHLGVAGSIACYKSCDLLRHFLAMGIHVSACLTPGARQFVSPLLFSSLGAMPVYTELFADSEPFAHLEPGQNCKALLVCPASASLIARMAQGMASDMLSAQILAFPGPVAVAPAMNTNMWQNMATQDNIATLRKRNVQIIQPDSGELACGTTGQGRLAAMPELILHTLRLLSEQDMAGKTVLVTMGPTREPWDGVRFWTNPSTGTMGASLALCCWIRGATVHAVAGPGITRAMLPSLPGLELHSVATANDMYEQTNALWDVADMGFFSAAVADFSPVPYGSGKFKKAESPDGFSIEFTPNRDILKTMSLRRKKGQKVLGFAAETAPDMQALMELAKIKRAGKNTDVLAANMVNSKESGFGTATNAMAVTDRNGREEIWPLMSKADVAWDLCTWLLHC